MITVPGDTTMIRSENELSSMITVTEDNPVRSTAFSGMAMVIDETTVCEVATGMVVVMPLLAMMVAWRLLQLVNRQSPMKKSPSIRMGTE